MSDIGKLYKFVQNKDAKWQGIGLTEEAGQYQGVIYSYGKVTFGEEENEDGRLPLHFEWNILDSNGLPKEIFKDEFFYLIGDILYDIIDKQLENGSLQYVDTDH